MPAKSKSQFRLMKAAENNPAFAKKVGISKSTAAEYTSSNTGKKAYSKLPETSITKSLKKEGFYEPSKSKSERESIVNKVTTKPQRVKIVEQVFSDKKMKSGGVSLAVGRGEKLSTDQGAGLTAKGRAKYNREPVAI